MRFQLALTCVGVIFIYFCTHIMIGWVPKHDVAQKAALALLQSSAAAGKVYTMDTLRI